MLGTGRLEAFSDGVLAIIITIMVLELRAPEGVTLADLSPLLPVFLSYALSFINIGIYWNNHHHMLHVTHKVTSAILWANLHLLFWLSLIPFTAGWMGEHRFAATPTALYGVVFLMASFAYLILQQTIIRSEGSSSLLAQAVAADWKGKASSTLYLVAVPLASIAPWLALSLYTLVALVWLIPDRRIERLTATEPD